MQTDTLTRIFYHCSLVLPTSPFGPSGIITPIIMSRRVRGALKPLSRSGSIVFRKAKYRRQLESTTELQEPQPIDTTNSTSSSSSPATVINRHWHRSPPAFHLI